MPCCLIIQFQTSDEFVKRGEDTFVYYLVITLYLCTRHYQAGEEMSVLALCAFVEKKSSAVISNDLYCLGAFFRARSAKCFVC